MEGEGLRVVRKYKKLVDESQQSQADDDDPAVLDDAANEAHDDDDEEVEDDGLSVPPRRQLHESGLHAARDQVNHEAQLP